MSMIAGLLTAVAAVLARPTGTWLVRERLQVPRRWVVRPRSFVVPVVGAAGVGVLVVSLPLARMIVALTVVGVGLFVVRQVKAERVRRQAQRRRAEFGEAVGLMAAELRAGVLPQRVLAGLAPDFGFLAAAARSAELGGDVSAALRHESNAPGGEQIGELASAWMVAERAGAPLAKVLDKLEASGRDEREIEREVQSGVAPARATGRLMAVLPVVGLMLGSGMGSDPIALLTGTVPGALCLAAGSAFACAGVAWVNRIASAAERAR